jgi:hypothetical protein
MKAWQALLGTPMCCLFRKHCRMCRYLVLTVSALENNIRAHCQALTQRRQRSRQMSSRKSLLSQRY